MYVSVSAYIWVWSLYRQICTHAHARTHTHTVTIMLRTRSYTHTHTHTHTVTIMFYALCWFNEAFQTDIVRVIEAQELRLHIHTHEHTIADSQTHKHTQSR